MKKDFALHVKKCENNQTHATLRLASSQELTTMVSLWIFSIWTIDLVGIINPKSQGYGVEEVC